MHLHRACALLLILLAAACSSENPPPEQAPATDAASSSPTLELIGGTHHADNVIDFNPADLGADWQQSFLAKLTPDASIWVSTSDYVSAAKVVRAEQTREPSDPKYLSSGTLKLHVQPDEPLREEIVFVSLEPIAAKTWTVRGATEEELVLARVDALDRFESITGSRYTGPMSYTDSRRRPYTIDFDRHSLAAFVVSTQVDDFLFTVFQIPGDEAGQVTIFRGGPGRDWEPFYTFSDDMRARIPRIDVNGDGVPEILHSGPSNVGWDLAYFYPKPQPILRISPGG